MKAKKPSRVQQARDKVLDAAWTMVHKGWSSGQAFVAETGFKRALSTYARAIRQENRDRG